MPALSPPRGFCSSDSAGLLSPLLLAALQSGNPHSTASAQNGGDFPTEQGSTLQSQNSGADDIAAKTRSPEKDASLDGAAMERTAAASQNSTLAAALAEANAQSSEATPPHVAAGGRGLRAVCNTRQLGCSQWCRDLMLHAQATALECTMMARAARGHHAWQSCDAHAHLCRYGSSMPQ